MTAIDRTEALLDAEAALSSAVEVFVRILGPERGPEVASAIVAERIRQLAVRRQVVSSLARESCEVHP